MPSLLIKDSFSVVIPKAAFRTSGLDDFASLLLLLRRYNLLLLGVFLPFFDAVKARVKAFSYSVVLWGDNPFEKTLRYPS